MTKFVVSYDHPVREKGSEYVDASCPEEAANLMIERLKERSLISPLSEDYIEPEILEIKKLDPILFDVIIHRYKSEYAMVQCVAETGILAQLLTSDEFGIPLLNSPEIKEEVINKLTWVEIPEIQDPSAGLWIRETFVANESVLSIRQRIPDIIKLAKGSINDADDTDIPKISN